MIRKLRSCLVLVIGFCTTETSAVASDLDLILYGADGCVGHFAAAHLAKQPGLKWALAGRNRDHLQAVAQDLASHGGNSSSPEIIVASLDEKEKVKSWVARAKAVITAAGPFSVHGGEMLVQACAEAGVHYSDTSDEFYWQRWMIDRHDSTAKSSGSKIVISSGFCVLAGDLGSQLALDGLNMGSSQADVDAWLEIYNGGLSAGVINTLHAATNATYPKQWDTDPYVLAPDADSSLRVDSKLEGMSYPSYVSGEGMIVSNIFGPYDARLLRRSFVQLGQKVKLRVGATASLYPRWTAFLARHPGSWSKLTKCPNQAVYEGGAWAYRIKASVAGGSKTVLLSGNGDPGYHFTALGLAEAGLCLAGKTAGCLKASAGGVHTAMGAMDAKVLRRRLEATNLLKVDVATELDATATLVV
eukprot:TRINITY_DN29043_c0_g1_i1.p1 TRINITY_DN29043_c0_g1~~TRINITY_DN29043_c0_g1_i1.p1  ORF type:complete len:415 (-),score=54.15 TRINITY_DN29043_c0_g1_i1:221-1465(-)